MRQTTLSFLVKEGEVLLAMKKRGFGEGKWNGVGGKLKKDEDFHAAAIREIKEEIGVDVASKDLQNVGTLKFRFDGNSDWDQICQVYLVRSWKGDPSESEEMRPRWYSADQLPFEAMWEDDPHWLPKVLAGQFVNGDFFFTAGGERMIEFKLS